MSDIAVKRPLPVGSAGFKTPGWTGMIFVIITEASLFGYLLFGYCYTALQSAGPWPPDGKLPFTFALPALVVILASVATMWRAERDIRRGLRKESFVWLLTTLGLGAIFVCLQLVEWYRVPFSLGSDVFSSMYFATTGFDIAHITVGIGILAALAAWTALGYIGPRRPVAIFIGAAYWYFVCVVWIVIFFTFYVAPYLVRS